MGALLVAQQTHFVQGTPIKISLLTVLAIVVYFVLRSPKRKARRQLRARAKKKSS